MGGTCSRNRAVKKPIYVIGRKPEGKRPLGRPRRRWVGNICTLVLFVKQEEMGGTCSRNGTVKEPHML
jgi:hypothetical protein